MVEEVPKKKKKSVVLKPEDDTCESLSPLFNVSLNRCFSFMANLDLANIDIF